MCGIAGIIGHQHDDSLGRMLARMEHRGPNDSGEYRDRARDVALGMRRLSVLDLEGGHQPMANEDGSIWIVFNGEIYNAPALRPALVAAGHRFQTTHSDTEVLVHLYEEHGETMLAQLNGMFAFVIYDQRKGVLFGARDRIGEKPLYYVQRSGLLAFASELKCLLALPEVGRELNVESLFHYMSLLYLPGADSIFQGVQRLEPAHCFTFDLRSRQFTKRKSWDPAFGETDAASEEETCARIRNGLREAVRSRLLSDVPVGCSLSGGIDSAAIVGLLAEIGVPKIKTYSLGFGGADEQQWNELPLAREVAQRWDTEHHEQIIEPQELLRDLLKMVWHLDEPYGGGLPSWYVFRFMRESVTVGLTGTGGDELFGNYGKFHDFESLRHVRLALALRRRFGARNAAVAAALAGAESLAARFPFGTTRQARIRQMAGLYRRPVADCYFAPRYFFTDAAKREQVFQTGFHDVPDTADLLQTIYDSAGSASPRNSLAYLDFKTQLPEEFLLMTDRLSMAHSLEARVPFLDHRFVELALAIPPQIRTRRRDVKYLLKKSVADLLPQNLLTARKRGFVLPIELWLRRDLRPLCERLLGPERLRKQGLFQPEFYSRFVLPHLEGKARHTEQVWAALMFQLWHVLFIEEKTSSVPACALEDLG